MRIRQELLSGFPRLLLLLACLLPATVVAQGSLAPPCTWNRTISRDEYKAALTQAFAFTPPEHRGGRVVIADTVVANDVHPLTGAGAQNRWLASWIYESLVGRSPIDGQPIPKLADSWDISADGLTYTFHLNRAATWHDGQDVTAADVVFSYDVAIEHDLPNRPDRRMLTSNAIQELDEHTIQIQAEEPFATFLQVAQLPIIPKHIWSEIPIADWKTTAVSSDDDRARAVGTGPFTLVEFNPAQGATLAANSAYYDGPPALSEVELRKVAVDMGLIDQIAEGDIHLIEVPHRQGFCRG